MVASGLSDRGAGLVVPLKSSVSAPKVESVVSPVPASGGPFKVSHSTAFALFLNPIPLKPRSFATSVRCLSCGESSFGFHASMFCGFQPGRIESAAERRSASLSSFFELITNKSEWRNPAVFFDVWVLLVCRETSGALGHTAFAKS